MNQIEQCGTFPRVLLVNRIVKRHEIVVLWTGFFFVWVKGIPYESQIQMRIPDFWLAHPPYPANIRGGGLPGPRVLLVLRCRLVPATAGFFFSLARNASSQRVSHLKQLQLGQGIPHKTKYWGESPTFSLLDLRLFTFASAFIQPCECFHSFRVDPNSRH